MAEPITLKRLLAAVSGRPQTRWPDAAVHHGVRVLLLAGLALGVVLLFPVAPLPDFPVLEKGMVAEEDIIAQTAFPVLKTEAELTRDRQEAAAGVAPIFVYDAAAADTVRARVDRFFARADSIRSAGASDLVTRARLRELLAAHALPTTPEILELLRPSRNRRVLEQSLRAAVAQELPVGIASGRDLDEAAAEQVRVRRASGERLVARDSLLTASDFYERARRRHLPRSVNPDVAEFQGLLLLRFFEPSVRLDRETTEAARERARQAVPVEKAQVLKGERIVAAHEQVGDREIERLRAYQQALETSGELGENGEVRASLGPAVGAYLFNAIVLGLFGLLLFFYRPAAYRDFRHVTLLAFLVLALAVAASIIARSGAPVSLIPIAFPALVVAALWDGRMALNMSLVNAVLLSGQSAFLGLTVLFSLVLAGAAASLSVRVVRRRAQTWGFIVMIAAAYVVAGVVIGLLRAWAPEELGWWSASGTLNAIASAFAAMGFLPLFEAFTRITTDQTLLELADVNRPLLRRLQLEAPGTYAHSISVANLAEAAAGAIGANALLTRVGIYYHDIGKMDRPQYFIENQPGSRNPHDKLKPSMSATVVRQHVVEGLRMAEEAKLPEVVRAFIAEHHGTQSISFFYDRARELDPDGELDPSDYRYPGPRPQSKETAIAMLADSVESAARALQDPTPEKIRSLVDRIVAGKIEQHQLDDAPLTLGELSAIKEQFASVLSSMYHQRIDYPQPRDESSQQAPARAHGAAARG